VTTKKQNILFVVCAYAFFWVWFLVAGILGVPPIIVILASTLGTFAPTFALLVLFKKLYPGWTIKQFYKNAFRERLNFKLLLVFTIVWLLIIVGMVSIGAFIKGVSFLSLFSFSFSGFAISLFSGDIGEESGWRGHLQPSVEKKHSVIKASLIVGIIWAFWHTPTWFATGFAGKDLILYILFDILDKMSLAMIIGICYSRCRNLIVPMWIHFISNMFINPVQGFFTDSNNFYFYYILILVEALAATFYIAWYKKINKKKIIAA